MVNSQLLDISPEEHVTLKKAFKLYDKDGDGKINIEEFIHIVMKLEKSMNKEKATQLAQSTDKNQDQSIDFDEFVSAMIELLPFSSNTPPSTPSPPSSVYSKEQPKKEKKEEKKELSTFGYSLRKWNTHPPVLYGDDHSDDEEEYHKDDEDDLIQLFNAFDRNNDGFISISELDQVMRKFGEKLSEKELQDMMKEADSNRDGFIDFEEFKRVLK